MRARFDQSEQEKRFLVSAYGAGMRFTENRLAALGAFLATTEPVTILELWLRTKKATPRMSYATVCKLLTALVECGLAHREVSPADRTYRYIPVKMECTHDHAACRECGAVINPEVKP